MEKIENLFQQWMAAVEAGDLKTLTLLYDNPLYHDDIHLNINFISKTRSQNALQVACEKGHIEIVSFLLSFDKIAFHSVLSQNIKFEPIKKLILEYKSQKLFEVCKRNTDNVNFFLEDTLLNLNQKNAQNQTPIEVAMEAGHQFIVAKLISSKKADPLVLFKTNANDFFNDPQQFYTVKANLLTFVDYIPISKAACQFESAFCKGHFEQTEIRNILSLVLDYFDTKFSVMAELKSKNNPQWKEKFSHLEGNWKNFIPFLQVKEGKLMKIDEEMIQKAHWLSEEYKGKIRALSGKSAQYNRCKLQALRPLINRKGVLENKFNAWEKEINNASDKKWQSVTNYMMSLQFRNSRTRAARSVVIQDDNAEIELVSFKNRGGL